ncbi:hypothetical protein RLPCCGM1_c1227 [Rhizobium leguminosarum bv. phaseoli CCGM1]|nr:hypothetical protein RLPCCGM1_c1227 [Rhizobium leguminosarum bv. phaseoli CCGM1]
MDAPFEYEVASLSKVGFEPVRATDIACSRCDIQGTIHPENDAEKRRPSSDDITL